MNIPLSWLLEAANIPELNSEQNTKTFVDKLTDIGNAVDGIDHLGQDITNVLVGQIKNLTRHPDADKLWITETDIGTEVLQIITGADNLAVGDYIPVVIHGGTIVGGVKIKKGKMRGLDSNGMLCSIGELGYTVQDYPEATEEGIYVFPAGMEGLVLGADARPIMGLLEDVIDFDILSNRPDTNSIIGMAREVSAAYGQAFVAPTISVQAKGPADDSIKVEIANPAYCHRYTARFVHNVKIGPSPQWLRRRLSTAGIRPVNNIVDITNYVMLEYGQPLHAFDISAVDGGKIVVRTAQPGETLTTLDGQERALPPETLLITDPTKILGIAGVMGGETSKITDSTTTILFESANFDSANIRLTSRKLGLRTDASGRYEKGQDPNQTIISINRAMELVEQLACGDVSPTVVDVYPGQRENNVIDFTPANIHRILGIPAEDLPVEKMCTILTTLNMAPVAKGATITTTIPTYRSDMAGEADIAEEIARFHGLNNITPQYSQSINGQITGKSITRKREDGWKNTLLALGYSEAITYPFESPKVFDKLLLTGHDPIQLKNPLGEDFSILRSSILNGMIESLARNYAKGNESANLFELTYTYHRTEDGFMQKPWLITASYGSSDHPIDYLSQKGDVESFLSTVTSRPLVFETWDQYTFMHPGRTAKMFVKVSPNPRDEAVPIGILGELHPTVQKNYDIGSRVYITIFDVGPLHDVAAAAKFKYKPPGIYPAITRDIAFTVTEDIPAALLEAAIVEKAGPFFAGVKLFDVYQGEQVEAGYKSMAYSIKFRSNDKTLTIPDIEKPMEQILQNLKKKHSAQVRS